MVKLKGEAFWNEFERTEKSCDNDCDKCPMYLKKGKCIHDSIKSWKKWNANRKRRDYDKDREI